MVGFESQLCLLFIVISFSEPSFLILKMGVIILNLAYRFFRIKVHTKCILACVLHVVSDQQMLDFMAYLLYDLWYTEKPKEVEKYREAKRSS